MKIKIIKKLSKAIIASALLLGINLQAQAEMANYAVITDHLGTPEMLVDKDQRVVWKAEYDEFGKATILVEEVEFNLRLPGQYYDKETATHYNYYRDYNPELGGYTQPDPRGQMLDFSDPQRQVAAGMGIAIPEKKGLGYLNHNYAYVDSNPLMFTDPTGEAWWFLPAFLGGSTAALLQCENKSEEACGKKYPNHNTDPEQKRQFMACIAGLIGPALEANNAVTDPISTIVGEGAEAVRK